MTFKSMLMVGALCLSSVALVSAKSYDFQLSTPSVVGNVQLPAGAYRLTVDGTNAVLRDLDNNKTFTTPVKVDTEERKFDGTAVVTDNSGGANRLKSIELGGSNTRLEFEK